MVRVVTTLTAAPVSIMTLLISFPWTSAVIYSGRIWVAMSRVGVEKVIVGLGAKLLELSSYGVPSAGASTGPISLLHGGGMLSSSLLMVMSAALQVVFGGRAYRSEMKNTIPT